MACLLSEDRSDLADRRNKTKTAVSGEHLLTQCNQKLRLNGPLGLSKLKEQLLCFNVDLRLVKLKFACIDDMWNDLHAIRPWLRCLDVHCTRIKTPTVKTKSFLNVLMTHVLDLRI